jgi:REP element-mobilizing transposase RayT
MFPVVAVSDGAQSAPMSHSYPRRRGSLVLRTGRLSRPGQIYLVTFSTHGRRRLWCDFQQAATAARAIHATAADSDSRLLAWILMPDHCHLLVEPGTSESLSCWVRRLKAAVTRAVRREHAQIDDVWAQGFHDHALRRDENVRAAAYYLIRNPVRAGLVARSGMYSFWDACWI